MFTGALSTTATICTQPKCPRRDEWMIQYVCGGGLRQERICLQCGRPGFDPWVGKIPWRRAWKSTPVLLPGESPWTKEPGRLQSMGSQRVRHN